MFPPGTDHAVLLRKVHNFWRYELEGQRIIKFWLPHEEKVITRGHWPDIPTSRIMSQGFRCYFQGVDDLFSIQEVETVIDDGRFRKTVELTSASPISSFRRACLKDIFVARPSTLNLDLGVSGLEFINIVELSRRLALRQLAKHLGIEESTWRSVLRRNRHALSFVQRMISKERHVQSLYTRIFIDLRIWVMFNELQSQHFNKHDVVALLNTLFPLSSKELPGNSIKRETIQMHRKSFLGYILAIESEGIKGINQFRQMMTKATWEETRASLLEYFDMVELMVGQASEITDITFFQNVWGRPFDPPFKVYEARPREKTRSRQNSQSKESWDSYCLESQQNLNLSSITPTPEPSEQVDEYISDSGETITPAPKPRIKILKKIVTMGNIRSKFKASRNRHNSTALSEDNDDPVEEDIPVTTLSEEEFLALRQVAFVKAKADHKRKRAPTISQPYIGQGPRVISELKYIQEQQSILNQIKLRRAEQLVQEEEETSAVFSVKRKWVPPTLKFLKSFSGGYSQDPDLSHYLLSKTEREVEKKRAAEKEAEFDYLDNFGSWIFDEVEDAASAKPARGKLRAGTLSKLRLISGFLQPYVYG